jgi:hypothetical protein
MKFYIIIINILFFTSCSTIKVEPGNAIRNPASDKNFYDNGGEVKISCIVFKGDVESKNKKFIAKFDTTSGRTMLGSLPLELSSDSEFQKKMLFNLDLGYVDSKLVDYKMKSYQCNIDKKVDQEECKKELYNLANKARKNSSLYGKSQLYSMIVANSHYKFDFLNELQKDFKVDDKSKDNYSIVIGSIIEEKNGNYVSEVLMRTDLHLVPGSQITIPFNTNPGKLGFIINPEEQDDSMISISCASM